MAFAKDGIKSTNFHALSPADFENILQSGKFDIIFFITMVNILKPNEMTILYVAS